MEDPILHSTSDFLVATPPSSSIDALQSPDLLIASSSGAVQAEIRTLDGYDVSSSSCSPPSESMGPQSGSEESALDQEQSRADDVYCENSHIKASSSSCAVQSCDQDVLLVDRSESTTATDRLGLSIRGDHCSQLFIGERHTWTVEECEDHRRGSNQFGPRPDSNGKVGLQDFQKKVSRNWAPTRRIESPFNISERESMVLTDHLADVGDRLTVGPGLVNLGNTCFMNSILQCFTHTTPLIKALRSYSHKYPCESSEFCVFCALRYHIELALVSSGKTLSPMGFFNNLSYISSCFQRYQQEDAHEFLQCFLDKLERSCVGTSGREEDYGASASNLVEEVFGGRLVSKLWCNNCGHCSERFEPLIDMSLEIEEVGTLKNALESFTRVEKIDDPDVKMLCENCKHQTTIKKQLMLDKLPHVATFHLKRFKTDGHFVEKINKQVAFPLELDLKPYTNSHQERNQLNYKLFAVVVHYGYQPTSGHYLSYVRSSPSTWFRLDDTMVTHLSEEDVLSEAAYILFYAEEGSSWFRDFAGCPEISTINDSSDTSPKSVLDVVDDAYKTEVEPSNKAVVDTSEEPQKVSISPAGIDLLKYDTPIVDAVLDNYDEPSVSIEFAFSPKRSEQPTTPRRKEEHLEQPGDGCRSHSSKRSKKSPELDFDSEKKEALRYMNRSFMPGSRKSLLLSAMSPKSDGSRSRARYPCKKTLSTGGSRGLDHNVAVSR